jgi:hypothetical protein
MTSRGFGTDAARLLQAGLGAVSRVTPLKVGIDAIERGIERRSRHVVAPKWAAPILLIRMPAQRVIELAMRTRKLDRVLQVARDEHAPLTTELPERDPGSNS